MRCLVPPSWGSWKVPCSISTCSRPMNHPTHDFAETLGAFLPLLVVLRPREFILRPQEREKVAGGRMRVTRAELTTVEMCQAEVRPGVRAGSRLAPSIFRFMESFDIQNRMHIATMNPREHGVVAISRRGNNVSLSSGERAGVRAGFLLAPSVLGFMVRTSAKRPASAVGGWLRGSIKPIS